MQKAGGKLWTYPFLHDYKNIVEQIKCVWDLYEINDTNLRSI